ncbi:MAG: formimidoylglutamate deiminase, partial [Paracoccaceae bacterium]|nr:formimidoylglutamate deiminase [Paracoccaceae bacterium]
MTTIWAEQALLAQGWAEHVTVTLADGHITSVTPNTDPTTNLTGAGPTGTHRTGILLPAPTNLHSHAFQRAMAGLTERRGPTPQTGLPRDSFWTWRQLMFRFLDQLTPDDVQSITAFVQMQMLEAGYAAVAEFHYL